MPKDIGARSTFDTQSATANRGAHSRQKNLLENPCLGSRFNSLLSARSFGILRTTRCFLLDVFCLPAKYGLREYGGSFSVPVRRGSSLQRLVPRLGLTHCYCCPRDVVVLCEGFALLVLHNPSSGAEEMEEQEASAAMPLDASTRLLIADAVPHLVTLAACSLQDTRGKEGAMTATRATIYRSLRALRAQHRKKSQKEAWGSAKKSPKIPENVEIYTKKSNFGFFLTFQVFSGTLFADPQKDSFRDFFFAILGPEGPETPVNGRSGRNAMTKGHNHQEPKRTHKAKDRTNSTRGFSDQFEWVTGSFPSKTRVLRRIAPESSPECSQNVCHAVSLWYLPCPQYV